MDTLLIAAGSAVMALSYVLFLIPNKIVPGGLGGLCMLLNHLTGFPVGIAIVVGNVPLFWVGIRYLGRRFGVKSLAGMLLSSLLIDFFTYLVPLPAATTNTLLGCIFGGLMLGGGLGLVFRTGGSTGGADIAAQLIAKNSNLSTGSAILLIDFVVISLAGLVYRNMELSLYGYVTLYLQTRAVDLALEGVSYNRAVFVVTDKAEEIARAITEKIRRGATILDARGAYTDRLHHVVFSVMSRRETVRCRAIVKELDPKAFVVIT
ncbi:MAG: YitT family protein, partial [Deltaproteobacteria bacterium]